MSSAVIHEQHSFRLRTTWISPQGSDMRNKLMANEVFKKRAINNFIELTGTCLRGDTLADD
jgi:hypothetical protein